VSRNHRHVSRCLPEHCMARNLRYECQMLTSHRTPRMTDPVRREQQPQNAAFSIILSTTVSAKQAISIIATQCYSIRINYNIKVWRIILFRNSVMFNPRNLSICMAKKCKMFYFMANYEVHKTSAADFRPLFSKD
jgi:hypothetical protein